MKTDQEKVEVMNHFIAGGNVNFKPIDGERGMELCPAPLWNWIKFDYDIAEEDPYAELKKAAADPTKQVRARANMFGGTEWQDAGYEWKWSYSPDRYEIRDKPKPMKKVKLLAWFDGGLFWHAKGMPTHKSWKRVPSKDMEIEVEE